MLKEKLSLKKIFSFCFFFSIAPRVGISHKTFCAMQYLYFIIIFYFIIHTVFVALKWLALHTQNICNHSFMRTAIAYTHSNTLENVCLSNQRASQTWIHLFITVYDSRRTIKHICKISETSWGAPGKKLSLFYMREIVCVRICRWTPKVGHECKSCALSADLMQNIYVALYSICSV